ncbi:MAG: signal peptidase I [Firmicutes bacterium]|nr:signal peptidase I [Bacillota bacterium]
MEKSLKRNILEWVGVLALAVLFALFLRNYVVEFLAIDGSTMMPTLINRERIISYKLGEVKRHDIIIFSLSSDPRRIFAKRIIGLPGEEISIEQGRVFIDGQELEEEYLGSFSLQQSMPATIIEKDHYFVLGDNRAVSLDSRDKVMGTIPKENIRGRVIAVFWPISRWRVLQ